MTIFDDAPPALLRNWNPIERSRNEQGLKADSDRALGNVRGKPHADAISIFDQGEFISRGVLRYASYSLDMRTDILPMLIDARRALLEAAAAAAGAAKTINVPLSFPSALPGSYDRIRDRAYFLWENREGSAWWEADSNWFEAERTEAAALRGVDNSAFQLPWPSPTLGPLVR